LGRKQGVTHNIILGLNGEMAHTPKMDLGFKLIRNIISDLVTGMAHTGILGLEPTTDYMETEIKN
jgi:hypothetical protein